MNELAHETIHLNLRNLYLIVERLCELVQEVAILVRRLQNAVVASR